MNQQQLVKQLKFKNMLTWRKMNLYQKAEYLYRRLRSLESTNNFSAGSSGINTIKVSLTPTQIQNLAVTPIEVLPSPGAGKAISVINAVASVRFNTTPYTDVDLRLKNSTVGVIQSQSTLSNLDASQDFIERGSASEKQNSIIPNDSLELIAGGNTGAGDSPIDVFVTYEILNV